MNWRVMNWRDTRHRGDKIRARIALHKRKAYSGFIARETRLRNTSKASGFNASRRIRSQAEIYTIRAREKRVETSARIAPFDRFFSTAIVHQLMARWCCCHCDAYDIDVTTSRTIWRDIILI